MTREQMEQELRAYRENAARLSVLQARAIEIEHTLMELRADNSGIGAQNIDGMPHGTSPGSITERMALLAVAGESPEVRDLQRELDTVQTEAHALGRRTGAVERWLNGLNERERWVVEMFYFEGLFWSIVRRRYEDRYRVTLSDRWARQMKHEALAKMQRVGVITKSAVKVP